MQPYVWLGFQDGGHLIDHLQHGISQVIGHILTLRPETAQGKQLSVAGGDALVAACTDHGVVGGITMHPEAPEHVLAIFTRHPGVNG